MAYDFRGFGLQWLQSGNSRMEGEGEEGGKLLTAVARKEREKSHVGGHSLSDSPVGTASCSQALTPKGTTALCAQHRV